MKIVIDNHAFDYEMGKKIIKLKYEKCPLKELKKEWDSIVPATFQEIAELENLEQRRIGILCLGLERLASQANPELVDSQTIKKNTEWVQGKEVKKFSFEDTYELYKVNRKVFNKGREFVGGDDFYYVKCKDTSTKREYFLWVEPRLVKEINENYISKSNNKTFNAISSIAWTIQTNVPQGNIEYIIRQGDCILIKTKGEYQPLETARHLTEQEYRTLIIAES